MISNRCVVFEYKGKYAHFLKAEANVSALSYPFPTRTVLIGLAGAILGLSKDSPQVLLEDSNFAVMGKAETTHWHTAPLHQTLAAPLPLKIIKTSKGSPGSEKKLPKRIPQQWLIKPRFTVFAQLPEDYHRDFELRLRNRQWYYTPCLGLSEMMADIEFLDSINVVQLKEDVHGIMTLIRKQYAEFHMDSILERKSMVKSIRMPRDVSGSREFEHEDYFYETQGKPLFVKTDNAYQAEDNIISWL